MAQEERNISSRSLIFSINLLSSYDMASRISQEFTALLCLAHCGPVTQYGVLDRGHQWFRLWLVALLARSHRLNQRWLFSVWLIGTRFSEIRFKTIHNTKIFELLELDYKMCIGWKKYQPIIEQSNWPHGLAMWYVKAWTKNALFQISF